MVEFFSEQGEKLGDKASLRREIREIIGIPDLALQGALLSEFNVQERLSWVESRQTTREEDRAYSLLGIFGVQLAPLCGEGMVAAFKRLQDELDMMDKYIQDLHLTDPRLDKKRIEESKGGLLKDSYRWIFSNQDFLRWRNDPESHLLWVRGHPGKGKTMLMSVQVQRANPGSEPDLIPKYVPALGHEHIEVFLLDVLFYRASAFLVIYL